MEARTIQGSEDSFVSSTADLFIDKERSDAVRLMITSELIALHPLAITAGLDRIRFVLEVKEALAI